MFLILEALCIIMLINNLPYQKRKLTKVGNAISGSFFKTKTTIYCCVFILCKKSSKNCKKHLKNA